LGTLPASACDSCGCGGAGYGDYGYGPSWGYSSTYYVAPAFNPAPVVTFVPAPRVYVATPVYGGLSPPSLWCRYSLRGGRGWGVVKSGSGPRPASLAGPPSVLAGALLRPQRATAGPDRALGGARIDGPNDRSPRLPKHPNDVGASMSGAAGAPGAKLGKRWPS